MKFNWYPCPANNTYVSTNFGHDYLKVSKFRVEDQDWHVALTIHTLSGKIDVEKQLFETHHLSWDEIRPVIEKWADTVCCFAKSITDIP